MQPRKPLQGSGMRRSSTFLGAWNLSSCASAASSPASGSWFARLRLLDVAWSFLVVLPGLTHIPGLLPFIFGIGPGLLFRQCVYVCLVGLCFLLMWDEPAEPLDFDWHALTRLA